MKDLVSRSTFAYAALMFAVLFAPLISRDPNAPPAHTLTVFPDAFAFAAIAAIVFFCVRQALQHRPAGEPRFLRGFAFASIASGVAAVLYGLAAAGLAPSYFQDAHLLVPAVLLSVAGVWGVGIAFAALFALLLARAPRTAAGTHGRPA